jgi:outer membrane protein assembly factor BamB
LFSRAAWSERVGALALMAIALFATARVVHPSIANGMMGLMLPIFAIPLLSMALVVWAVSTARLADGLRRVTLALVVLLTCGTLTLVRTGGLTGSAVSDLHWRWTPTPEERLLADAGPSRGLAAGPLPTPSPSIVVPSTPSAQTSPQVPSPVPMATSAPARVQLALPPMAEEAPAEWPGFRGAARDSVVRSTPFETDWERFPPIELWRQGVGPGWSSFAVHGERIYTQEQRGADELVSCYDRTTGTPLWRHRDSARFWESNGGAGPRGTPTLAHGRVYTLGATGILNALDARDGAVLWTRNAAGDTRAKLPGWGFASSPLVVGELVVVATAGVLAAYDAATGRPRWSGPRGGWGYSSPQLATLDGVAQVVLLDGAGAIGVAPADGAVLWRHAWPGDGIVQPAVLAGGDLLLGSGSGMASAVGLRRVAVKRAAQGWAVEERWTSAGLKPYFNDFVVHDGHAYGFDGSLLACVDLTDGTRKWKGGRYGHGQVLLLSDQGVLLVLSEEGELALVQATSERFVELARRPALEGKTWNHPVVAGDLLLVRNAEQMVAFRLPRAPR